jgi:hypothetical protein
LRLVVSALLASTILGTSVGLSPRGRDLLLGIFQDVGAILNSFAGGPNDPQSPVTDQRTLKQDSERLDAATRKANELASELTKMSDTQARH